MKTTSLLALLILLQIQAGMCQGTGASWQRSGDAPRLDLQLFHSTHSINLPTAETLQHGDLEMGIAHRFVPLLKDGEDALFGLDGPAIMRIALGYAPTDRMVVTLGRSNLQDNVDLRVKYKLLQLDGKLIPLLAAVRGGVGWNTIEFTGRSATDSRNFQFYVQGIFNTLIGRKFGIGIVPTYLNNSSIYSDNTESSFALGINAQWYFARGFSLIGEWIPVLSGYRDLHNVSAFALEIETGGHFFKLIVSNSIKLNPSQVMSGTPDSIDDGDLHLGFQITRLLRFK